jgi:hypothetical protein
VSLGGHSPYVLLAWPERAPLPRVGANVTLRLLPPQMGMGALGPELRRVFEKDMVRGLRVMSVEGPAAREYSNILHGGAPPRTARAVKLSIPAGAVRKAPQKDRGLTDGAAKGAGGGGEGGAWGAPGKAQGRAGGGNRGRRTPLPRSPLRALPLPLVSRGPVQILGLIGGDAVVDTVRRAKRIRAVVIAGGVALLLVFGAVLAARKLRGGAKGGEVGAPSAAKELVGAPSAAKELDTTTTNALV